MPRKLQVAVGVTVLNLTVLLIVLATRGGGADDPMANDPFGPNPAPGPAPASLVSANSTNAATPAVAPVKPAPPVDLFASRVKPFLTTYCYGCHGEKQQKADLALHGYSDPTAIRRGRKTWLQVASMIKSGDMPEGKGPKPTQDERDFMVQWIDATLNDIDCENRDPGRVTIRRLNREEYNNTVGDLLGVEFRPADDFPTDDVGYGFDNIGDVLSMPPVLMEKYFKAAQQVAAAAVANDPGRLTTPLQRVEPRNMEGGERNQRERRLTTEGDMFIQVDFRRDGLYEFRIDAYGELSGAEPPKMILLIDDKELKTFDVGNEAGTTKIYTHRQEMKKGNRKLTLRYPNNFKDPEHKDPKRRDRNLHLRYVEILGPIQDKPELLTPHQLFVALPKTDGSGWREAATENLDRLARRAFRRPVAKDEVEKLVKFVELARGEGESFEKGMELATTAVLCSPHFLFRIELDPDPKDPNKIRTLNDHELASRLSYFLWSSMPDYELTGLADKGGLRDPKMLAQQVRSMIQHPRSAAMVRNFAGQWLQLRSLERITPDPKLFPEFDQELRYSMLRETELFFDTIIREDRSVLEFLDGKFTFVNNRLARHYGLGNINATGDEFVRVELDGAQRSGILTQGSILTISSNPTRTSPVLRGKYVLEELLGTPPPPAPPDVPELPPANGELSGTLRQRMEQHRVNPTCASCHQRMDPIGFGLENYDAIGRWRTHEDKAGKLPVDVSGTLPSGESFKSPAELKAILRKQQDLFVRCLAEKMLTYALGRGLEYYDKCTVDDIVKEMKANDYRFSSLVLAIVKSDPFQKRRAKLEEE